MIKLKIREVDEICDIFGSSDSYIERILTCPYCGFEMLYFTVSPANCRGCKAVLPYMPAITNRSDVRRWWHRATSEKAAVTISKSFM